MPVLLLIRHGDNDHLKKKILYARLPGVHLNEHGRQQAELLAAALADVPLAAVYASPLERAVETAQPIAAQAGLEVCTDDRLLDTDIGEWQGKPWKTMTRSPLWKTIQFAPARFRFPGGESFLETQVRVVAALDAILAACRPEDWAAVVFHADPIKLAVAHYLGLPLDHFQRLACDTGSVTVLGIGEHGARLMGLNQRPPFTLPGLEQGRRRRSSRA
jgi:probable phosphoglycerate mutase